MDIVADSARGVSPMETELLRLARLSFCRWLVETGRINDHGLADDPICIRCQRRWRLSSEQAAAALAGYRVVHRCGMPQHIDFPQEIA